MVTTTDFIEHLLCATDYAKCFTFTHLNLTTSLWGRENYIPHYKSEDSKAFVVTLFYWYYAANNSRAMVHESTCVYAMHVCVHVMWER